MRVKESDDSTPRVLCRRFVVAVSRRQPFDHGAAVRFHGVRGEDFHALAIALQNGLPVGRSGASRWSMRTDTHTARLGRSPSGEQLCLRQIVTAIAAQTTTSPGDAMLRLDLLTVAALGIVVVDVPMLLAVLGRNRVEGGNLHCVAPCCAAFR